MQLDELLNIVMDHAVELVDVTSRETELLRVARPLDAKPIMDRKIELAGHYQDLLQKLIRRREMFASLDDAKRAELRELGDFLKYISSQNARLLQACAVANEHLLAAIKEASAGESSRAARGYDCLGKPDQSKEDMLVSLGVEHTI